MIRVDSTRTTHFSFSFSFYIIADVVVSYIKKILLGNNDEARRDEKRNRKETKRRRRK
jgi:hypothetical protein